MNYKDNAMYKAFWLKYDYLSKHLLPVHDHTLSKMGMFANDAFAEQQATIDRLETEKAELIELIMTSNAATHYQALEVAKKVAKEESRPAIYHQNDRWG